MTTVIAFPTERHPQPQASPPATGYAELQVTSNFSFLRGASHAEELVERAKALGHVAIAVTDRNTLAGVVRAHVAAREAKFRLVVGTRLDLTDAPSLLAWPKDRAAYGNLSRLLSLGQRRAPKGECHLTRADVLEYGDGFVVALLPPETPDAGFAEHLRTFVARFGADCHLAAHCLYRGDDAIRLDRLAECARETGARLLATNDVNAHDPARRPLQDVLTCIREGCTIDTAGYRLFANAERHLKTPAEMARLFRRHPDAITASADIVARCSFSLDELRYEYPVDPVPDGRTPQQELARLAWAGAAAKFPDGIPDQTRVQIKHELALIAELNYAPYFLTVHDIVRFARSKNILCQGRGSAANSAVCFYLGITAVDPARMDLLFERFISSERNEPPDIDVDFEHERREEVIQYIYEKYGRDRAGIAATVIHYRSRNAMRDVGKALGLSEDAIGALAGQMSWRNPGESDERHARDAGLDPRDARLAMVLRLARELTGFPRHLSQHVGGFVITKSRLDDVVPISNAAMVDRTVIEWDKDDLDALGILKIDVLALGMLTCIRKALALIEQHGGPKLALDTIPAEDPVVYDMLCRADSLGVFQVESRAQMSMLPRLRPRNFYDLVIEVAIVRPGPIQGDMVHPYLRRRNGEEPVDYPSEALRQVLGKTMGVPLFQEQAMKIAIVAAGFTPAEADRLRRAMATFRRSGTIHLLRDKMIEGMVKNGYARDFAERCYRQIEGFGEYGFPESHAASFALLVYASSWIKCHHPAVFAAALLNSQPMGFYAPAQIIRDARDHGVSVRPVDVNASDWDCTLERTQDSSLALRLGFRQAKSVALKDIERLMKARGDGYPSLTELVRRARPSHDTLHALAEADAFRSLGLDRRAALFQIAAAPWRALALPLFAGLDRTPDRPTPSLPRPSTGEEVTADYASLGLSLTNHPLALLRDDVARFGAVPCRSLATREPHSLVSVAGLVLVRQRPGTASGVIFMTIEDETGIANLIVWSTMFERFRRIVLGARLIVARGVLQREREVIHLVVRRLEDRSDLLRQLTGRAVFRNPLARTDEVARAVADPSLRKLRTDYPSRDFH